MTTATFPTMNTACKNGVDHHMTFASIEDFASFAMANANHREGGDSWTGGQTALQSIAYCEGGDTRLVEASDKFLAELEDVCPVRRRFRIQQDVCGGSVALGAYLAGVPKCMKRRVKLADQLAPLAVFVDLTSSAGISAESLSKRGTAVLALVRLLSTVRPVELHAVVAIGSHGGQSSVFLSIRIETAPMDLGRACHILTAPSVPRALCYQMMKKGGRATGAWAFDDVDLYRAKAKAVYARTVPTAGECLYLAPPHVSDASIVNPAQWVKDMLTTHSGLPAEE